MRDGATQVWCFKDAPKKYKALSPEGADWLAMVPKGKWKKICKIPGDTKGPYFYQVPMWLESPYLSKEGIYFFEVGGGRLVVIGKV